MRIRVCKWLRSFGGKPKSRDSSSSNDGDQFQEAATAIQAKSDHRGASPSPFVSFDHQELAVQDKSIANPSIQLPSRLSSLSHDTQDDHRLSDIPSPISSTPQALPRVDVVPQPLSHATASLSWSPLDHPQASFLAARPVVQHQFISLSPYYEMRAGSTESLMSAVAPSMASSSGSTADEDSEMEEDGSGTPQGVFLDPSSMMPPNVDRLLALLTSGRQIPNASGPVTQNSHDTVAFLGTNIDFSSLSEAWTCRMQTAVQSSA